MKNGLKTFAIGFAGLSLFGLCIVPAPAAANGSKVEICHIPPGNPGNFHTINVSVNAQVAHLAHGDVLGPCDEVCATLCDDGDACTIDDLGDCELNGCPTQPVAVDCDDGEPCTDDWCDPASGCENTAVDNGLSCDDGDRCSGECWAGACEFVEVTDVYFTTDSGVYLYSSDTEAFTTISSEGSYSIALSQSGDLYVGKGGLEATALSSGLSGSGIFQIDLSGVHQQVSNQPAEDLQFDPNDVLHFANASGIHSLTPNGTTMGTVVTHSANPTSQFAFESTTSVVTTNGTAYGATFSRGTNRIDLVTDLATSLNGDGGEDIHVRDDDGYVEVCGQGGLFEMFPAGGAFTRLNNGTKVFNFDSTGSGTTYVGNADTYASISWSQGVYRIDGGASVRVETAPPFHDVNALVVDAVCEE